MQHTFIAGLQRVAVACRMADPDIYMRIGNAGFQRRVPGQGVIDAGDLFGLDAAGRMLPLGAPQIPHRGQDGRRAHYAEDKGTAEHRQPVKPHLRIGLTAVEQQLDTQHDENCRRKPQYPKQVKAGHQLVDHQQNACQNQHQRKRQRSHAACLFRGGFFVHDSITSFILRCTVGAGHARPARVWRAQRRWVSGGRDMSRPYPAAKGRRAASVRPPLIRRCGVAFPQVGKA